MGRRLVVTMVLDEGLRDDVYDQLAQVVCAARGVVGWRVERYAADGEEQDRFGPVPAMDWAAFGELGAVSA